MPKLREQMGAQALAALLLGILGCKSPATSGARGSGGVHGSSGGSGVQGTGGRVGGGGGAADGAGGVTTGQGGAGASTGGAAATGDRGGGPGSGGSTGAGAAAGATATGGRGGATGAGGQTAPVDQTTPGTRAALPILESFDGIPGPTGNPSDVSIAVGPNHIVQVVNWSMAVYSKRGASYATSGMLLRGPVASNSVFAGFGGSCQTSTAIDHGDVVVRYDQLAQRWVFFQPVLRAPYKMCYAVSTGPDPLGTYYRYEFTRSLFPDYPRPGIWPDGYYVGTSTGDDVVQKHLCVADRTSMLSGQPATEQCLNMSGANFLNPSDLEGTTLPPAGAPNLVLATGGTQLNNVLADNGVYAYKFHVDWTTPAHTTFTGPTKVTVAPYSYLCGGQLTNCVPQPNSTQRLDAQGDKLMQRVVYRNFGTHQSLVVTHSITGPAGGGGLRWYEFRVNAAGDPALYQQSTYAPDTSYRWLGSAAMDRLGNIGIGYSFGGAANFPGQRFAARSAADPLGTLSFQESVLIAGQASQSGTLRWEDFATTAIDPSDDATFWYAGDYLKTGGARAIRIGSFRVP
jgi:hypothetical protein